MTAEEVTSSIQGLQSALAQIRLGGGDVAPFQLLGIDTTGKDAFQVLEDIRMSIQGLDSATAVNLIKQTGLSPNFINVLKLTNDQMAELDSKLFLSPAERSKLLDFGTKISRLKIEFLLLKDRAALKLIPVLERMGKFLENNASIIYKIAQGVGFLIDKTIGLKGALVILTGVAVGLGLAFQPLYITLLLIMLVFDDIATWMRGGQSLFGGLYDWIANLGDALNDNVIQPMNDLIKDIKESDFMSILPMLGGAFKFAPPPIQMALLGAGGVTAAGASISQSNTFNIQSNATDGRDVARSLQLILSDTLSEFNNSGS